jgi:predicted acetyltransferase
MPLAATLEYRYARREETGDVAALVAHSFPGATRPPSWWEQQLADPPFGGGPEDTLLVGLERGRPAAALQLHPLRQWIGGELLEVAGVGTVSVSPTHRRRRLAAELMTAALQAAWERGDAGSALYPFRVAFYQRLGYGAAGEVLQYQVPPESLPDDTGRMQVELLEGSAGWAEALQLYGSWAPSQNGQLRRSAGAWSQLGGHDKALAGYRAADGTLEGYALVTYRPDLPPRSRYLEVDELVWVSNEARRGLYGWLASLGDQWQQLLLRALPSHRLGDWLREPRLPHGSAPPWRLWTPAATLLAGPMFRIVHMERAWERRTVAGPALALELHVRDEQIPGNDGRWRLVLEHGRARAERNNAGEAGVRLGVATLSRLFAGALSASAAAAAGLLECDRPERLHALDTALALPDPWTFDRF